MPLGLKITLIVLGAIVGLLALLVLMLLTLRIKIKIGYSDTLHFKLYVGGIRIASLPRPPKKLRPLRTYTKKKAERAARKYARRPEDHLETIRQNALYRALMQKRAEKKAQKKKAPQKPKAKREQPEDKLNVEILLQMIAEIIDAFFEGTRRGLHIHVCRFHLWVVGKDAAQTALLCGGAWAAVSNLLAVLDAHAKLRVGKTDVQIIPDYTGEKTKTDFSLVISFGIARTLHTLLSLIPIILKHKDTLVTKPKAAQAQAQTQSQ